MGEYIQYERLEEVLASERKSGKRIVLTGGCFDIIHSGHSYLLEVSAGLGDVLVVNITSDDRIKRYKDEDRPIMGEMERARVVSGMVDYVTIYPSVENNPTIDLAFLLNPDVLVQSKLPSCEERKKLENLEVEFQLIGRGPDDISSGEIIERIRKSAPRNYGSRSRILT